MLGVIIGLMTASSSPYDSAATGTGCRNQPKTGRRWGAPGTRAKTSVKTESLAVVEHEVVPGFVRLDSLKVVRLTKSDDPFNLPVNFICAGEAMAVLFKQKSAWNVGSDFAVHNPP